MTRPDPRKEVNTTMPLENNLIRPPTLVANGQQAQQHQQEQPQQQAQPLRTITIDPMKYANKLPTFDGATESLKTFIDAVDTLIPILQQYDVASQRLIANIIKTKIIGKAQTILNINCNAYTWTEIREILISNFSDKKNSYQLLDELKSTTFNGTVLEFYNEIQRKLQRLNIKSELEGQADVQTNKRIALDVLKYKIIEPIRSVLFSRNPQSLEESLQILTEGNYLEYRVKKFEKKTHYSNKPDKPIPQRQFPQQQNTFQPQNNFRPKSQQFHNNFQNRSNNRYNNSVQSRIRRFGQPEPMDIDASQQFVQTNTNFPTIASEDSANTLKISNRHRGHHECNQT